MHLDVEGAQLFAPYSGALEQRVVTLTAELAASRMEHSAASERAAELEQLLQNARTTTEQLEADLAAAQTAYEHVAGSEGAASASEQTAREELETCRSAQCAEALRLAMVTVSAC